MAEKEAPSLRDQIRSKTVGSKNQFKTERVDVGDGIEVAVKQPSVGERQELFERIRDENGNVDQLALLSWAVIKLTYVPDSQERVFDDTDYDTILEKPTGGWVDRLGEKVLEVLNVDAEEGKS